MEGRGWGLVQGEGVSPGMSNQTGVENVNLDSEGGKGIWGRLGGQRKMMKSEGVKI